MPYFIPITLIGVLILITLILLALEYFIVGTKEKTLTINDDTIIPVTETDTLLNTLTKEKLFIPSACGGKATCGMCKCRITEGGGEVKRTELPFLSQEELDNNVRLSCQVKVNDDMKIEIPKELLNAKEYKAKVTKINELTYDIKEVRVDFIEPKTMDFLAGQYAQIKVPGIDVVRAYSISSDSEDNSYIEFIIRYVPKGLATTYVHKALRVGDIVNVTGPYGDFYLNTETNKDIICIAGGSGKAPILSILDQLKKTNIHRKVKYFFGAKAVRDLYYTEELRELEKEYPNFEYIPALSEPLDEDHWDGETGLITEVVDRLTGDLKDSEAYLCGSPGMINACINVLKDHDMPDEQIFFDKFS